MGLGLLGMEITPKGTKHMAVGINSLTISGRVEPNNAELKTTNGGKKYLKFTVVTTAGYFDNNKQWVSQDEWTDCTIWGDKAERHSGKILKGDEVVVMGSKKTEKWQDKNNKLYFLEINTHPGFTENSLVPKIAKYQGISFLQVTEYLLNTAKCAL